MNTLKIENITLQLPGKLDEMNSSQLEEVFSIKDVDLQDWQARLVLFKVLVGQNTRFWWFRLWNEKIIVFLDRLTFGLLVLKQRILDSDDWYDLMFFYTDFLFDSKQNLTRNPYPFIWLKGRFYRGPKGRFQNLTFGEFVRADEYFLKYQTTKEEKYLDRMIAVMWRFGIRERQKFDFDTVEKRIPVLSQLSQAQKQVILVWYIGCRKILEREFKHIYPEPEENQKEQSKKMGLSNIAAYAKSLGKKPMEYAPTPSDADVESIYHANVYYVLRQINQDILEYKKLKEHGSS